MSSVSLLLLALAAPQAPVEITVAGTVSGAGSAVSDPAFATVSAGDAVELRFELETPGNLGGAAQFDIFDIVGSSISFEAGSSTVTGGSSVSGCFLFDRPSGGAGDILTATIDLNPSLQLTLTLRDDSNTAWDSVAISDNFGIYLASAFDAALLQVEDGGGLLTVDFQSMTIGPVDQGLGTFFCAPAIPNSTGSAGELRARGSLLASANDVTLSATSLPLNTFGIFVVSLDQSPPTPTVGSVGNLCLGGSIGRYMQPGQILSSGSLGEFTLALDLTQTPQGNGNVSIAAGETWSFQGWHRDVVNGVASSNFTQGLQITLE